MAKNQLSAADARQVEEAFAAKLALIPPVTANVDDVTAALNDQSLAGRTLFGSARFCMAHFKAGPVGRARATGQVPRVNALALSSPTR